MKKLLVVFGIGISVFFAGFSIVQAQEDNQEESICDLAWNTEESAEEYNPGLYEDCKKAEKYESEIIGWMRFSKQEKSKLKAVEISGGELTIACNNNNSCSIEKEKLILQKAQEKYAWGMAKMNELRKNKEKMSQIEMEKLFLEAVDYFKQAEKLARKPIIHSGGILPGPKDEESGEDFLLQTFLNKTINFALVALFSIGTLMLIIGGGMFLFAAEDDEMKTKAKNTIFWAVMGLVITIMSYAIVKFVVGLDFGF